MGREVEVSEDCTVRVEEQWALENDAGAVVWDAALVLAHFLIQSQGAAGPGLRGKRVVEIGSGTGLVGLVAAALGASPVLLTDLPHLAQYLDSNIKLNGMERVAVASVLEWGNLAHIAATIKQLARLARESSGRGAAGDSAMAAADAARPEPLQLGGGADGYVFEACLSGKLVADEAPTLGEPSAPGTTPLGLEPVPASTGKPAASWGGPIQGHTTTDKLVAAEGAPYKACEDLVEATEASSSGQPVDAAGQPGPEPISFHSGKSSEAAGATSAREPVQTAAAAVGPASLASSYVEPAAPSSAYPDVILGSDLVYKLTELDSLFLSLALLSRPDTTILLSQELRPGTEAFHDVARAHGFVVQKIPEAYLHPEWRSDDIHVYVLKKEQSKH